MLQRTSRLHRIAIITATAPLVLLVAIEIASFVWPGVWVGRDYIFGLTRGYAWVMGPYPAPGARRFALPGWYACEAGTSRGWSFHIPNAHWGFARLPSKYYGLPLWMAIAAIGPLGPFVWWRHARGIREGRCAQCSYDLRGLPRDESGAARCPECGTAAPQGPIVAP